MGEEKKPVDYAYLDKVEIKGLFGKYDLEWELNRDVNILSGINGSGKSTILGYIAGCLLRGRTGPVIKKVDSISCYFSNKDNTYYKSISNDDYKYKVTSKSEGQEKDYKEVDNGFKVNNYDDIRIYRNEILNIYIVDTFGTPIENPDLDRILKASREPGGAVSNSLDVEIYYLQKYYLNYQLNLGRRVKTAFKSGHQNYDEAVGSIYARINLFHEIINELFNETGKMIDEDSNILSFIMDKRVNVSAYELSAGEKQLLIILLTLLIQDEQPCIFFLDEPELSLHIDWQRKLIGKMRSINPKAQLVIATHSPGLIIEGWGDKVFEVRDLITNKRG